MALVRIVYVADAERRGPDLTRIGTVEDIHPDLARMMVDEGSAVWASEEDVVADEARRAATAGTYDAGGQLNPGSVAVNQSTQPIVVLTPAEVAAPGTSDAPGPQEGGDSVPTTGEADSAPA